MSQTDNSSKVCDTVRIQFWRIYSMLPFDKHSTPQDILSLKNTRIFVAGDTILDTYIEGKVNRISPEAPVPVVLESNRRAVPGGAGNVAANIASMGAAAYLCGRVGNDSEAHVLKGILEDFGIETSSLIISKKFQQLLKCVLFLAIC